MKKLLLITALLLSSFTVSAQQSFDANEFCFDAGKIAGYIMLARQTGITYEQAVDAVSKDYEIFVFIVDEAFKVPVVEGDGGKVAIAQAFGKATYKKCVLSFSS